MTDRAIVKIYGINKMDSIFPVNSPRHCETIHANRRDMPEVDQMTSK